MKASLLAGVVAIGWGATAGAAPLTATYDFAATFANGPNASISGFISLSYDPAVSAAATVNSFASSASGTFTPVRAYHAGDGRITFGNTVDQYGNVFVAGGNDQFYDYFSVDGTGAVVAGPSNLTYSTSVANAMGTYASTTQVVVEEVAAAPVPEPASLALVALGVAGVAAGRQRRVA